MHETNAASAEAPLPVPTVLSGHQIISKIGRGGMGSVWLARDSRLDRRVAIKTLHPELVSNEVVRTRFMQEARALAMVNHPNIVRIYNLGPVDETPHFVMEYIEGSAFIDAATHLTIRQKVEIMRKVALAVDFLHQHGIVHRDLKPGNILVGPDFEPKLLDFGLARLLGNRHQPISESGFAVGTPKYFSPEQTVAGAVVDERSDVFALGTILYEILTGRLPFDSDTLSEQARAICDSDPELPKRINPEIAGDLQNVCLKALEKRPADRYATARDMAQDLERFLAGEPPLAQPTALQRIMSGRVESHLRELHAWRHDEVISQYEYDNLRKAYDHLSEKEDAWLMELRRLTLPQVTLYMGAWVVVLGSALILLFEYQHLRPFSSLFIVGLAAAPALYTGLTLNRKGEKRVSIAYLLAFCLLMPIALLLIMDVSHLWRAMTQNRSELEFMMQFHSFKRITNAQLWWSIFLAIPGYIWLRWITKSSVFSMMMALMASLLGLVTLLRFGLLKWEDYQAFSRLLWVALVLFGIAFVIETMRQPNDSKQFYGYAVAFTIVAFSGLATTQKMSEWLDAVAPFTRGKPEYLFILNAGIYYLVQRFFDRINTPQLHNVAKVFRFIIPGHVMTSMMILGIQTTKDWEADPASVSLHTQARALEVLLPIVACLFVFASLPKQMKNYVASGLVFLAVGLVRLQQNMLKDHALWPIALIIIGFSLMLLAVNYPAIRIAVLQKRVDRVNRAVSA
jgi:serine/threonine protein kinase